MLAAEIADDLRSALEQGGSVLGDLQAGDGGRSVDHRRRRRVCLLHRANFRELSAGPVEGMLRVEGLARLRI